MNDAPSSLREIIDNFGHQAKTFCIDLITGKSAGFRIFASHSEFVSHRNARAEWVKKLTAADEGGNPTFPVWREYLPVSEETACNVYNLAHTSVEGWAEKDLLELAKANPLIFETMAQMWVSNQIYSRIKADDAKVDDLKNSSAGQPATGSETASASQPGQESPTS